MTDGPIQPGDISASTPLPSPQVPTIPQPNSPPLVSPPGVDGALSGPPTESFVPSVAVADGPPKKGAAKWALVAVGALAVSVLGVVAFRAVSGGTDGASSPDAAVDRMLRSLSAEDPVGMVNAMSPSEMRTLGSLTEKGVASLTEGDTADQLAELGIDLDVDDLVPGLTIEIIDAEYEVEQLSDDVARVNISDLEAKWSFDTDEFFDAVDIEKASDGLIDEDEFEERLDSKDGTITEDDLPTVDGEPFLMAVNEEGSWFVSPTFTIMETARIQGGYPEADFDKPVGDGAESVDAALEQMAVAVGSLDVDNIIDALPPSKYRAFYAYRDMLFELADGVGESAQVSVDISETKQFDSNQGIGLELIDVRFEISSEGEGEVNEAVIEVDGKCVRAVDEYTEQGFCLDDLGEDAGPFADGVPGIDKVWVIVAKEDGEYYVDPIGTIISYISAVDRDALADIIDEMD